MYMSKKQKINMYLLKIFLLRKVQYLLPTVSRGFKFCKGDSSAQCLSKLNYDNI